MALKPKLKHAPKLRVLTPLASRFRWSALVPVLSNHQVEPFEPIALNTANIQRMAAGVTEQSEDLVAVIPQPLDFARDARSVSNMARLLRYLRQPLTAAWIGFTEQAVAVVSMPIVDVHYPWFPEATRGFLLCDGALFARAVDDLKDVFADPQTATWSPYLLCSVLQMALWRRDPDRIRHWPDAIRVELVSETYSPGAELDLHPSAAFTAWCQANHLFWDGLHWQVEARAISTPLGQDQAGFDLLNIDDPANSDESDQD